MDELILFLKNQDVEFHRNEHLAKLTSVGIGGVADIFVVPKTKQELVSVLNYLRDNDIPFFVVGNMTNVLPTDGNIRKVIISTRKVSKISFDKTVAYAECGTLFSNLILKASNQSLGGCEKLFGIPGTVGGMLAMNAGAYGASVSEYLCEVELYDQNIKSITHLKRDGLSFSYRDSEIKRSKNIVLSAKFSFDTVPKNEILEKIGIVRKKRLNTQPISEKTLGSVFKKSQEFSASYLIDKCGLKGVRIGQIEVSDLHAGFFINKGGGTARDFLTLCDLVKRKVSEKYGVILKEEFEYLE